MQDERTYHFGTTGRAIVIAALLVAAPGCKRSDDAVTGRDLFTNACARCHSNDGSGGLPIYNGGPSPRKFRDAQFQSSVTDEQIRLTIVNGKGTGMPAFGTMFTDSQLRALVGEVRGFDPSRDQ